MLDKDLTVNAPSPDPATATNLFTFDANRLSESFTNLGCLDLNPHPVRAEDLQRREGPFARSMHIG